MLTGARFFRRRATSAIRWSSGPDSALIIRIPALSAAAISSSVLPTPEKTILPRRRADLEAAHQLAARDHVETGIHRGEQFEHAQVGERLHRKANQMVGAGERFVEDPEMAAQRASAVGVKGGADLRRQIGERYVFGEEPMVAIVEVMHAMVTPMRLPPTRSNAVERVNGVFIIAQRRR